MLDISGKANSNFLVYSDLPSKRLWTVALGGMYLLEYRASTIITLMVQLEVQIRLMCL
jgi:hypothetical protein